MEIISASKTINRVKTLHIYKKQMVKERLKTMKMDYVAMDLNSKHDDSCI